MCWMTSVFQRPTFSVMPSLSIMMRSTPASMNFLPMLDRSDSVVSPPAPNRMPHSGLAIRPLECTLSTRRSQSSWGSERKPVEISTTSNPRRLHTSRYLSTAACGSDWVRTCSIQPPWSLHQQERVDDISGRKGSLYRRYVGAMLVGHIKQLPESSLGEERKGAAGKLDTIHVMPHSGIHGQRRIKYARVWAQRRRMESLTSPIHR